MLTVVGEQGDISTCHTGGCGGKGKEVGGGREALISTYTPCGLWRWGYQGLRKVCFALLELF